MGNKRRKAGERAPPRFLYPPRVKEEGRWDDDRKVEFSSIKTVANLCLDSGLSLHKFTELFLDKYHLIPMWRSLDKIVDNFPPTYRPNVLDTTKVLPHSDGANDRKRKRKCCKLCGKSSSTPSSAICQRCRNLKKLYNITCVQKADLLKKQAFKCKCCNHGIYWTACIDHVWIFNERYELNEIYVKPPTGFTEDYNAIMGVLCKKCNSIIGNYYTVFRDSPYVLAYIHKWKEGWKQQNPES